MITNFFRLEIPFDSFQIQRLPYSDDEFTNLKAKHNKDASFFRHDNFIYISPSVGSGLELAELSTLDVNSSIPVVLSLIRHLLFRTFREATHERIPQSFSPLRFFSTHAGRDAIRNLLPPDLQGRIRYPRMAEIEARQITENGQPVFGLLIRSRQRWQFNVDLTELRDDGFPLIGKTVLETQPILGLEGVLAPDENLLGEIVSIDGDRVEITSNAGLITRDISSLQLQRTREQIGAYLAFKLGDRLATRMFERLRESQKERERPSFFFSEALEMADWFISTNGQPRQYANEDGFCFTVTPNNFVGRESVSLHRTSLIFDYGPGASSNTPLAGLQRHGPFNAAKFEKNDLRVLVVYHRHSRGAVTQFVKRLIDGMPDSKYFQLGLKALFRLTSVEPILKEVNNSSPEEYEDAVDNAVKETDQHGYDIALNECPDGSRLIHPKINPYYRARARLMGYGIPTQGMRDEHLRSGSFTHANTLGPLALQMYAKVGGTPWRLPANQSVDKEILIGVGNSIERPNLWSGAEQSRIVGITTFFLGDGSYIQGERLKSVPYKDYFGELLSSLQSSIENISYEFGWKVGSTVRIVFHIFKPIKHIEADVVAKLIENFPQYKILFAFVTIAVEHPWMMFRGMADQDSEITVNLCERSDNVILDSHNCLLQIRGDRDRPNKKQRPPHPVLIRIHEKSNYTDLKYIVDFIGDNWHPVCGVVAGSSSGSLTGKHPQVL